jgi:outer membrane protein assembly factor BamE (lipoprotein component of BamABCDE complex)
MRSILILTVALGLSACSTVTNTVDRVVYKLPTRQGNVIDQKQLDQLKVGMTRDQVKFVMGTAVATGPFAEDRWDYIGYYKSPRGEISERTVTLYFADNKLSKMNGVEDVGGDQGITPPNAKSVIDQQKKEKMEDARTRNERVMDSGAPASTPDNQKP